MPISRQFKFFRDVVRKTHNLEVAEFFRDLPGDELDNSSSRAAVKAACLIGAGDSQGIMALKFQFFEKLKAKVGMFPQVYDWAALPDLSVEGKPQIQIWFYERYRTAKSASRQQARARISFRINDDNGWTLTEARSMALKIKNQFATPIYHFSKGRIKASYRDTTKGYRFFLLVPSLAEAKRVFTSVFDVIGDTPDWDSYLTEGKDEKDHNRVSNVRVLDKNVRIGPSRPETEVYFRHAIAKIPPLTRDFPLVDTVGDYWNALYYEPNPYLASQARSKTPRARNLPLTQ